MEDIIAARGFKAPIPVDAISAALAESSLCFGLYRADYRWSFFALDGTRLLCRFRAPDAEAVRQALRQTPPRPEYVHAVSLHGPADSLDGPPRTEGDALVVVERHFESPQAFDDLQAVVAEGRWCLDQYRVRFLHSCFARDRQTMVCAYRAPDAEAVRAVQRTIGLPYTRLWSATVFTPPPSAAGSGNGTP